MLILFYFIPGAQMANMFVYVHVNEVSTLQKTPFCIDRRRCYFIDGCHHGVT